MKTVVTRADRDRSFVAVFSGGTLYVSRALWQDASSATQPCGEVGSEGVVRDYGPGRKQFGYVDTAGQVFSGHQHGKHELLGTVRGSELISQAGEVFAIADGPDAKEALAAALLLILRESAADTSTRFGLAQAAGSLGSAFQAGGPAESLEQEEDIQAGHWPVTTGSARAGAASSSTPRDPDKPMYLPRHTRKRWGRHYNPGDRVHVRKPMSDQGPGVIIAASSELEYGAGTKLYPRFLVQLDVGGQTWANGTDLTKLSR